MGGINLWWGESTREDFSGLGGSKQFFDWLRRTPPLKSNAVRGKSVGIGIRY